MKTDQQVVRLSEYQEYGWRLAATNLKFNLFDDGSFVETTLKFHRDGAETSVLRLDGEQLELLEIEIDGNSLSNNEYSVDDEGITIFNVPDSFTLRSKVKIHPEHNTALEGLYKSSSLFCTQCEAESFRRITYYPDRPDVSSIFTTSIEADKTQFPILLSNGNLIDEEELAGNRHTVTWHDPFRKPCYLFALVAGDLAALEDEFITQSNRRVRLTIYTEPQYKERCGWAMDCLKRAMKWDEEVYGREYDLDRFMIVAVDDFNFGAMENKGLNIFNASALLASPDTSTDGTYRGIERIIAHEYFHNWSGNRVTCRDWFQLSLKEGFTVFRDTQFSESTIGETAKRIGTVAGLRGGQFSEDAGNLAHPVRPTQYTAITNFYTSTIYEKGAEVLRMMYIMAGKERWRKATDLYFERHDGCAVTIEDFAQAVSDATELDLSQFFRWYIQAGTPRLVVQEERAQPNQLTLTISQSCAPTSDGSPKDPFHIPLAFGIVDSNGKEVLGKAGQNSSYDVEVKASTKIENPNQDGTLIAHLKQPNETLVFSGLPNDATVSFLRGFSAPVYVEYSQSVDQLTQLALHDTDGFSKWNSLQSLYTRYIRDKSVDLDHLSNLVAQILALLKNEPNGSEKKSQLNAMLSLPSVFNVLDEFPGTDFDRVVINRDSLLDNLASSLVHIWEELYVQHDREQEYKIDSPAVNRRATRNLALSFYCRALRNERPQSIGKILVENFRSANNLTDRRANFVELLELPDEVQATKDEIITEFYQQFENEPLLVNQWFAYQSSCSLPGALDRVRKLEQHPAFTNKNPNRVRSVYGVFAANYRNFHTTDGSGYRFISDKVLEIEQLNENVAARLAIALTRWTRFGPARQKLMQIELRRLESETVSKAVTDVVKRGLSNA